MKLSDATGVIAPDSSQSGLPRSVIMAARLMYAGAALTLIGMVTSVIIIVATGSTSLRAAHPHATAAQIHATINVTVTSTIIWGLIEAVAWVLMARLNQAGPKWARITATAFFGLNTLYMVLQLARPTAVSALIYSAIIWLVGLGAIYFLWSKESAGHFA